MTLQPGNSFTVVRQIANHTDPATYFVRAVIRNAYTDDIIETLNLTDAGGQRFRKNWQVPGDTSGQGFYISIVTSVYTDSGYTTKSENYGDEENTYLIQERVMPLMRGGGGIDAYTVRRIMKEELENAKPEPAEPIKLPEIPKAVDRFEEVIEAIRENKPVPAEKVDLGPVLALLEAVKQAVNDKEVTPATDLAPAIERLQQLNQTNGTDFAEVRASLAGLEDKLLQAVQTTIKQALSKVKFVTPISVEMEPGEEKKREEKPRPFDLSQLTL